MGLVKKTLKLVHALCSGTLSGSQVPSLQIVHLPLQGVNAELIPPESLVQDAAGGQQLAVRQLHEKGRDGLGLQAQHGQSECRSASLRFVHQVQQDMCTHSARACA